MWSYETPNLKVRLCWLPTAQFENLDTHQRASHCRFDKQLDVIFMARVLIVSRCEDPPFRRRLHGYGPRTTTG